MEGSGAFNGFEKLKRHKDQFPDGNKKFDSENQEVVDVKKNEIQEDRIVADLEINRKTNIDLENRNEFDTEKEKKIEKELAEKWVGHFLSEEILDKYALSYIKTRKPDVEKRKTKKYQKYLEQAQKKFKTALSKRLAVLISTGDLKRSISSNEIKAELLRMIRSDMRITNLAKEIEAHQFEDMAEPIEANDMVIVEGEHKSSGNEKSEVELKPEIELETENKKEAQETQEATKTKKEFFEKYDHQGSYFDPEDGSEFQILNYDPDKKAVTIYRHQSFVYDKETEAWGTSKERGREETLEYDDFVRLIEKHISDTEIHRKQLEEQQEEMRNLDKDKNKEDKNVLKSGLPKKQEKSEREKLNKIEIKLVEIFEIYIEDYRQAVGERVRENKIIKEDTREKIENDYVKYFVENELAEKITSKLRENNISGVSLEEIFKELKIKAKLV